VAIDAIRLTINNSSRRLRVQSPIPIRWSTMFFVRWKFKVLQTGTGIKSYNSLDVFLYFC